MEEVCGFKGLDGRFYEKAKECELADLKYKIADVHAKLNSFTRNLDWEIRKRGFPPKELQDISEYARAFVIEQVLDNSDIFLEIISRKEELADTLSKLHKEKDNFSKPWYLKIKWW